MTDEHDWAVRAFKEAHAALDETPARQEALEIAIRMLEQGNAYTANDDLGGPTLCFSFPDGEPSDPLLSAISELMNAAGWRRAAPDLSPVKPVKFERRIPAR